MSEELPTWQDLEAVEFNGRLYFSETIRRRSKSGAVEEEVEICLRVPRKDEKRAARIEAVAWASKLGLNRETDKDLFDEMEDLCVLARSIRERKSPHDQYQKAEWLESHFDSGSIAMLWDRLNVYDQMIDPRDGEITDKKFWQTVLAIGRTRTALPLTGFAPHAQARCLVSMADQALLSPTLKSFLESCDSSTPEP
jgi:hypothetical protein